MTSIAFQPILTTVPLLLALGVIAYERNQQTGRGRRSGCGGANGRSRGWWRGLSNAEIAHKPVIDTTTVKSHLQHLYQRLGVSTRYQVVLHPKTLQLL